MFCFVSKIATRSMSIGWPEDTQECSQPPFSKSRSSRLADNANANDVAVHNNGDFYSGESRSPWEEALKGR